MAVLMRGFNGHKRRDLLRSPAAEDLHRRTATFPSLFSSRAEKSVLPLGRHFVVMELRPEWYFAGRKAATIAYTVFAGLKESLIPTIYGIHYIMAFGTPRYHDAGRGLYILSKRSMVV